MDKKYVDFLAKQERQYEKSINKDLKKIKYIGEWHYDFEYKSYYIKIVKNNFGGCYVIYTCSYCSGICWCDKLPNSVIVNQIRYPEKGFIEFDNAKLFMYQLIKRKFKLINTDLNLQQLLKKFDKKTYNKLYGHKLEQQV